MLSLQYILGALAIGAAASPVEKIQERHVPAGSVISSCTTPGTVALTFDDGPFIYTDQVLNELSSAGAKATFFLNGQNWGNINDFASTVWRMENEGHQVGSHTWSHPDLAGLDSSGVTSQMTQLESALLNILGKFPTYMRPPYFSYNDATVQTLAGLGYKVIHADIDTLDWQKNSPGTIGQSVALFESGLDSGGSMALAHDVHQTTASTLVSGMIRAVQARGLRAVTVGECLGDSAGNWYRTYRDGSNPPTDPPPGGAETRDGQCGGANGYRCPSQRDKCCSEWGWCGDSGEHCGSGCNPSYGVCW